LNVSLIQLLVGV